MENISNLDWGMFKEKLAPKNQNVLADKLNKITTHNDANIINTNTALRA